MAGKSRFFLFVCAFEDRRCTGHENGGMKYALILGASYCI